ncbi:MAG: DUF3341 domain-containing protein [Proteobacteria bacterium]|jgi:hypothetical protein|nr:DUF3341 domain-containing protein [Pseudomonadota bacterium]
MSQSKTYGLLASFEGPADLVHAAEKVRDAGYKKFDCHSPFPIHGMDDAMGLKRSSLGKIAAFGSLMFCSAAIGLQWWASTQAYPLVLSGKEFFSYQAFVPITFELSILGAALFTVFGMFALNRLPTFYHPLFNSKKFETFSDDGFLISIEAADQNFDMQKTTALLQSIGGKDIEVIEDKE